MNTRERGAARRYAQALFELALERGQAEDVRAALRAVRATLQGSRELRLLLLNPAVSGEKKKAVVGALWSARAGAQGLVARLVQMLAERHRAGVLERVEEVFSELWNAHRRVLSAELVSATTLDDAQLQGLRDALRRTTGRDVEFKAAVDARVLGGVRLTMDGRVYDGTLRARLQALRTRLVEGSSSA